MSADTSFDLASFMEAPPAHALPAASRRRRALLLASGEPAAAPPPVLIPSESPTHASAEASGARPEPRASTARRSQTALVLTLSAGSLACAAAAILISILRGEPAAPSQPGASDGAADAPARVASEPPSGSRAALPDRPGQAAVAAQGEVIDASGVVRALRRASFDYRSDPRASLERYAQAIAVLGDSWVELDRSQRVAALELAVEFLLRASEGEDSDRAIGAAFAGVDALVSRPSLDSSAVLRGVWSAGLASRLLRERDLPGRLRESAEQRARSVGVQFRSSLDASFEQGAIGALRVASEKLAAPPADAGPASRDAWGAWDRALGVAAELNPGAVASVSLDAAERVLASASARPSDVHLRDRLTTLLAGCDWASTGDARARLLSWLEDHRRFATREVAVVTQWLSINSPQSGLGVQDTLASSASSYQRSELRSRLSARWGSGHSVVASSVLDRWKVAASLRGKEPWDSRSADALGRLREGALIARLNEAAALLWRGEADAARRIIDDPSGALSTPPPGVPRLDALMPRSGDGIFALRYLNARQNAQDRIDILRDLLSEGRELGPIDAEVVFDAAMLGTPSEVRRIAGRIVEFRSSDPAVINAALESLPRAPRTRALQDAFEATAGKSLPPIDDPAWPVEARRALVNRLLAVLTGGASLDPADTYAAVMRESFATRANAPLGADASPRQAAEALVLVLVQESSAAGGLSAMERTDQLRRRHIARRAIAENDMQRFAAEATNAAEAFALLMSIERPALESDIESVLASLRDRLAASASVADQMVAAEFATLSLWALRFGQEESR